MVVLIFLFSREPFTLDQLVTRTKSKELNPELLIDCLQDRIKNILKRVEVNINQFFFFGKIPIS